METEVKDKSEEVLEPEFSGEYPNIVKNLEVLDVLAEYTKTITAPTPKEVLKSRGIRGGGEFLYAPGYWLIGELNALQVRTNYRFVWNFDVLERGSDDYQVWVNGKLSFALQRGEEWITFSRSNFGGGAIKLYSHDDPKGSYLAGDVVDIADDFKGAATDCLRKCASMFGMMSNLYGTEAKIRPAGPDETQLKMLYKRGEQSGNSVEQVKSISVEKFGVEPEVLPARDYLVLIRIFMKKKVSMEEVKCTSTKS